MRYYAFFAPKIKNKVGNSLNHIKNKCVLGYHHSDVII